MSIKSLPKSTFSNLDFKSIINEYFITALNFVKSADLKLNLAFVWFQMIEQMKIAIFEMKLMSWKENWSVSKTQETFVWGRCLFYWHNVSPFNLICLNIGIRKDIPFRIPIDLFLFNHIPISKMLESPVLNTLQPSINSMLMKEHSGFHLSI